MAVRTASRVELVRAILGNARMLRVSPRVIWFLCRYLRKFRVIEVGGNLVVHSHLPPLNSKAYRRFVNEQLVARSPGPTHAQVGVTNECPQNCEYCYNIGRTGRPMSLETILGVVRDLKTQGVLWIGLTGGEPLMNPDLPRIVESIGGDCASKLFTTGCGLTKRMAAALKRAGLVYVSVSLDHWIEEEHDRARRYPGAFQAALGAIETFLEIGGLHVSVSAVLSRSMLERDQVEEFLAFLRGRGVHEAWLSETKPSAQASCSRDMVITAGQHAKLVALQDRHNRQGGMTVNYLGHFEDAVHFGCAAGNKMVYVDAFGEVSPCVFIPMTFGNVRDRPLAGILAAMRSRFPSESCCFINANFTRLQAHARGTGPIETEDALRVLDEIEFGPPAEYFRLQTR